MTARNVLARPSTAVLIGPLAAAAFALSVTSFPVFAQATAEETAPDAGGSSSESGDLPEGVLAIVNGRPVPSLSVDNIVRQIETQGAQGGQPAEPPDRARILDELIDLEILTQKAEEEKLDEQPEIAAALQLQYTQTMANAYLAATGDAMKFTDEDLRAEYDAQTAGMDAVEYRAAHILLETEEDAQAVIDELAGGGDFAELAAERSTDPGGADGGDLGWFQGEMMVPEFTAAIAEMEPGSTSEAPVKSEFGYHVIRLDETRGAALPEFESVRPGLENLVMRNRLAETVEALRDAAEVQR